MRYFAYLLALATLVWSCNSKTTEEAAVQPELVDSVGTDSSEIDPDTTDQIAADQYLIEAVSSKTAATVRASLLRLYGEDLKLGIVDSLSRRFIFFEHDLNADGTKEIFVGLTGPYFCGSGGCTQLLLDQEGVVISKFTVSDYPLVIDEERTNAWKDLFLRSDGDYRRAKFDGTKYPSNPSLLPKLEILPGDGLARALDWENDHYPWFRF